VNEVPGLPALLPVAFRMNLPMMDDLTPARPRSELPRAQWNSMGDTRDPVELYDIIADPYEVNNLADDPAYAAVKDRLLTDLAAWRAQIDDTHFDELAMVEAQWPGLEQPVTATPVITATNGLVTITSATEGASIGYRYGTDDEAPWHLYTAPIALPAGQILQAKAIRYGYAESDITLLIK